MVDSHEKWDVVSNVGVTALAVCTARAFETERSDRLINDPYAAGFVRSARVSETLPAGFDEVRDDSLPGAWFARTRFMGVRTRFFDEFTEGAAAAGITQFVDLASGLDTRAQRLDLPAGAGFFEIEKAGVLEFKQRELDRMGAQAACDLRLLGIDLRDDWVACLAESGHESSRPTAWLAEGLLPYLPAATEEELLRLIGDLSAPGSRLAIEHAPTKPVEDVIGVPPMVQATRAMGFDILELFNKEERRPCAERLREAGWEVSVTSAAQLAVDLGTPFNDADDFIGESRLITAYRA